MATVNEITHDSSTTLADFYDSIDDPDGAITVTTGAALGGSTNGLAINFDAGANNIVLVDDFTPNTPAGTRLRCRVDLSNATHSNQTGNAVLIGIENAAGSSVRAYIEINIDEAAGDGLSFDVDFSWGVDAGTSSSLDHSLPSGETCIELRLVRETADGNNDGEAEGFINGVSQFSLSNIQNFNKFDFGRLAAYIADNSTKVSGTGKADEFLLTDVPGTALCPVVFSGYDLVLGGGQV